MAASENTFQYRPFKKWCAGKEQVVVVPKLGDPPAGVFRPGFERAASRQRKLDALDTDQRGWFERSAQLQKQVDDRRVEKRAADMAFSDGFFQNTAKTQLALSNIDRDQMVYLESPSWAGACRMDCAKVDTRFTLHSEAEAVRQKAADVQARHRRCIDELQVHVSQKVRELRQDREAADAKIELECRQRRRNKLGCPHHGRVLFTRQKPDPPGRKTPSAAVSNAAVAGNGGVPIAVAH
eukprot:TRINITY_DN61180_c0_g1_i1.p2 TRINITY_DN61180_c0_g1~~TRINITY_DN61180_c0_g1_i1.p2  ORF type:complete len:238 (-),score=31.75 TRINITY_DN61180_c0_g1_i1:362-1075(-)